MTGQGPLSAGHDYRPDIDGLRAIAVLMVVAFHSFPSLFRHGYIGVDVFFVISGYLITGILLKSQGADLSHLPRFYGRRVRRIFPALLVVLASTAVIGYVVLLPAEFRTLDRYMSASALFVGNVVAWLSSGYFEKATETTPLLHLWSLAIEEQFYIVWPLLLWGLGRLLTSSGLAVSLAILSSLSFAFGLALTYSNQSLAYYHPLARAWELIAGAWLASRVGSSRTPAVSVPAGWIVSVSLCLLGVCGAAVGNAGAFPGAWALVPVVTTLALIAWAPGTWAGRHLLSHPVVVHMGRISYPLYLWHWVILAFLHIAYPSAPWTWTVAAVALSFLLAAATYHWVEQPLQQRALGGVVPALALMMVMVFALSFVDEKLNIVGKQQTALQRALEKEYDPRPAYRYRTCFLDSATQVPDDFASACVESARSDEPRVLLWGDSLVAQLYPGLLSLQSAQTFVITQRTASSCPPSVADAYPDRGHCDAINASTRQWLGNFIPDIVIISGRWGDGASAKIGEVVRFLRLRGVRKIVLVGPTPDWVPDLRGLLSRMHFLGDRLPEFLQPPPQTWRATRQLTEELRVVAASLSIDYLSLQDLLCQDNGCRIKVSEDIPDGLIASDHDHLTAQASEFLFRDLRAAAVVKP